MLAVVEPRTRSSPAPTLTLGLACMAFVGGCLKSEQFEQRVLEHAGRELLMASVAHEQRLGERTVHLDVQVCLDRMPCPSPNPRALQVYVRIVDEYGETLSPSTAIGSRVLLMRNGEGWESPLVASERPDTVWKPTAGGPFWEPGDPVDVFVEVSERADAESLWLSKRAVRVRVAY